MFNRETAEKFIFVLAILAGVALFTSFFAEHVATRETADALTSLSEETLIKKETAPPPPVISAFSALIMREKTGQA
ncbi:MAG: hypothetical protein HYW88_02210, partial [Candidatus Sungbacteria bacterium]|nr:hypothetical protein [Candidatus Sungbacteria bacterium]